MISIVYFSPTGNTFYLAKKLGVLLGIKEDDLINLAKEEKLDFQDHVLIMFPIHGFNPPEKVVNYMRKIRAKKVSFLGIGCNTLWMNDAVSKKLRKIALKKNIKIIADEILAMPLTFIMSFPDQVAHETIIKSENRLKEIAKSVLNNQVSDRKVATKSKIISSIGQVEKHAAKLFGLELHADKSCISCGKCWNDCPAANIKPKGGKPSFGLKCMMCMKCIYECPEKAIKPYISRFIPIKGGYHLEDYLGERTDNE